MAEYFYRRDREQTAQKILNNIGIDYVGMACQNQETICVETAEALDADKKSRMDDSFLTFGYIFDHEVL